ncbi:hypothetical protein KW796_01465 [Candidatus Parcubacteria bacterium]|nr:hypothetical protein [Candidatus Parcubacteria bacterium]
MSGLLTLGNLLLTGSSTLQNFTFVNATGTSATTTNFFATNASTTNLFATAIQAGTATFNTILANASSTLQNFTFVNATGTSATTTNFFATNASTTNFFFTTSNGGNETLTARTNATTTGTLNVNGLQFADNGANNRYWTITEDAGNNLQISYPVATDVRINQNFLVSGSTTLQNFTSLNATTAQATTTALAISSLNCSSGAQLLQTNSSGSVICGTDDGGAGSTPGGNAGAVQFNDGASGFTGNENYLFFSNANKLFGIGSSTPTAILSASSTTALLPVAIFDQRSTGGLLTLQRSGVDKFTVSNDGGLNIYGATSDSVKTTTGTGKSSDFDFTGSTIATASTTATNGYVTIIDGTISGDGIVSATTTTTGTVIGNGAQVIIRSDGQYVIIQGGGTATASIWDGFKSGSGAASMATTTIATGGTVNTGAIAVKRPDGRYVIFHGGAANLSSIFDPYNITAAVAGPPPGGACTTGTNAFLRPDGKYVVICGGTTGWGVYDPSQAPPGSLTAGTAIGGNWGAGAHALSRDDGTFLVYQGGGSNTFIYNPFTNTMTAGPTAPAAIAAGALSVRRQDGTFLTLPGAANTSYSYNPVSTTTPNGQGAFVTNFGVGPSSSLSDGSTILWRQDGKYTLITANTTVLNVVDPGSGSIVPKFTNPGAPLALSGNAGAGITAFMLPNGRYAILRGGGQAIDTYDMNFATGLSSGNVQNSYYESECIDNTNLSLDSTLNWNKNDEGTISAQIRTVTSPQDCSTATYRTIQSSGSLIGATTTANNRVQFKFFFQRELPRFLDQEWGVRKTAQTRYRRVNADPVLYDVTVDNSTSLHRTQFDFGNAVSSTTAPSSGPVAVNITNDTNRNNALALAAGVGYGTTINTANNGYYNGAFGFAQPLSTPTASTTVVMKRPDGKFTIIAGNNTINSNVYDPALATSTAATAAANKPTVQIGNGALAFKRPDGKFLIVMGNTSSTTVSSVGATTTNIYDPVTDTYVAGPNLATGGSSNGAGAGAAVIPLPSGRVLIIHGNATNATSVYDPVQNTMTAGPNPTAVVGYGSIVIPRPNGQYMFIPGMVSLTSCTVNTTVNLFDPYAMVFTTNAGVANAGGTGPGAFALQRSDGTWLIVRGGASTGCLGTGTTAIYDPVSHLSTITGPGLSTNVGLGAYALPRPDGTWLLVNGGGGVSLAGQSATQIYIERGGGLTATGDQSTIGAFISGPTMNVAANSGGTAFQLPDGKFAIITGAATTTTSNSMQFYDAGWVASGIYRSEQFDLSPVGTKLDSNSTLNWKSNMISSAVGGISAEVRSAPTQAALATSTTREIPISGGLINPAATDTWLQINFNFRRSFPSYGGIYSDVWYSSASMSYPLRPVVTPTLYEFKITKDDDLLTLNADGLALFRVNSGGDVYTSTGGTINTSGADLAERYTSQEPLDFGEVVSVDPMNNHAVKKTSYQYQPDALGVVSTDPGFVAGAYTEDSYPIALVGRVPVKVSTENGFIRAGDKLTAASVPGYAMKATLAGHVIGHALENLKSDKLVDCPASSIVIPGRKCGVVMMFVSLGDFIGEPVGDAMMEYNSLHNIDISSFATTSVMLGDEAIGIVPGTREANVLNFLENLRKDREAGSSYRSEVFADRVSAVSDIIAPNIFTRILKAESVEGLTFKSDKVIANALVVNSIGAEGTTTLALMGDVNFFGRPYFTSDTAGSAIIKKGAKTVEIIFDKEYIDTPIVSSTIALESASTSEAQEEEIFTQDIRFIVSRKSVHGFTIILNKPAPNDIGFSWIALAVKDSKLFTSREIPLAETTPITAVVESVPPPPTTPPVSNEPTSTTTMPVEATSTPSMIETTPTTTPSVLPSEPELTPQVEPESTPIVDVSPSEPSPQSGP